VGAIEYESLFNLLESPWPLNKSQPAGDAAWRNPIEWSARRNLCQGTGRDGGIPPLMRPEKTDLFHDHRPVNEGQFALVVRGVALDHPGRLWRLRGGNNRHSRLDDPALFRRDFGNCLSEVALVIQRDRSQHRGGRRHYVCRVESSAETRFEDDDFSTLRLEPSKRQRSCDLEESRRVFPSISDRTNSAQASRDGFLGDHRPIEADALAEGDQMRRRVQTCMQPSLAADRIEHRADRTFPVGPGDVNKCGRTITRTKLDSQIPAKPPHLLEAKLDAVKLQPVEPGYGLGVRHFFPALGKGSGAR
jgi:hypothetical protein